MAVVSIKNKLRRGNLLVGNDAYDPGGFVPIATTTVGSGGSSSITFSSIPSTYTHLQIRAMATVTSTGSGCYMDMRFNSDSGSNYSDHGMSGDGSSVTSYGSANSNAVNFFQRVNNMSTTAPSVCVIDILDYANTNKYKTVRNLQGNDRNGSGELTFRSGSWRNTNAISSISIAFGGSYTLAQGSSFTLYGIKSA